MNKSKIKGLPFYIGDKVKLNASLRNLSNGESEENHCREMYTNGWI